GRDRRRVGRVQIHGAGAQQRLSPGGAVLRSRSRAADDGALWARRSRGQGGGTAVGVGGVRDRLPPAGGARRHWPRRRGDAGQLAQGGGAGGAGGRQARPLRKAAGEHARRSAGDAGGGAGGRPRRGDDGQLQLPAGAGGAVGAAVDRQRNAGRDPALAGGLPPGLDQRPRVPAGLADEERTGRVRGAGRYRGPHPRSGPLHRRAGGGGGRDDEHLHQGTAAGGGERGRFRPDGGGGDREGAGHRRRRDDVPGPVRQRRDGDVRGDPARAGAAQLQQLRGQRLERQPRLQPGAVERVAGLPRRRPRRDAGIPDDQRHRTGAPLHRGLVAGRAHPRLRAHLRPRDQRSAGRDQGGHLSGPDLRGRLPLPGRPRRGRTQRGQRVLGETGGGV
ncbi:MAG: Myo-inositol 2-dehydrogenase, partial [uncultured Thermomicrobiales bacterium]